MGNKILVVALLHDINVSVLDAFGGPLPKVLLQGDAFAFLSPDENSPDDSMLFFFYMLS